MKSGWDELPNVRALVSVLLSCMSKMNVRYNRIKKGFNACSHLLGSWWVDSGVVGSTECNILEKQGGWTWACFIDKELNPTELATKRLSSISGSWQAELGNPACSDPFEIVACSIRKEIGTRDLHISSRANGYLRMCSTLAVGCCALGGTRAFRGRNLAFPGAGGRCG